jgi:hypothetical protein
MQSKTKEHLSNYKIQVEYDRKSGKTLDDIIQSDEFKEIVRKILMDEDVKDNNGAF